MSQQAVSVSAPSSSAATQNAFVAHAKLISLLTLVSRILGMAREAISAHFFGAGLVSSAFTVAFTIPNLFRKLFGEGALSAAFIPLYAQALKAEQDGAPFDSNAPGSASASPPISANEFAAASVNLLALILLCLTLIGEAILLAIMWLDESIRPDRLLTLQLTAIMLPYVLLICGTAFLGAILQVHRRFGAPAAAPIVLNLVHIIVIFLGAQILHLKAQHESAELLERQRTLAYWLAVFVLVAGVLQVLILLRPLRAAGFRFMWVMRFWTPPIRKMLRLSVPVALSAGVLQVSVLLDRGISLFLQQGIDAQGNAITHFAMLGASFSFPMEMGAPARLNWAQFLYQFPLGVFAIAVATAIFPALSADAADRDLGRFREGLRRGILVTLFEGFPASVGLMIVAVPAVQVLFRHGNVTDRDATLIARSVLLYSTAIWAFSLQQILNRAYYALHDTRTPLFMSIATLVVNLAVEIPLLWAPLVHDPATGSWQRLGEAGMAAGTAASFTIQALVMLWMLNRRVGGLDLKSLVPDIGKMLLATALMAGACWLIQHTPLYPTGQSRTIWVAQLALLIATGATVYLASCAALGISIREHLWPART